MHRFATLILVSIGVAGCASTGYGTGYGRDYPGTPPVMVGPGGVAPASPLARSVTYACEDLTTVTLTEGQRTAQVTLNSGLVLNLTRQPGFLGSGYGAPPYEFRGRGGEGTFIANNRAVRCRMR
jgi:hypothetical protein